MQEKSTKKWSRLLQQISYQNNQLMLDDNKIFQ